MLNIKNEVLIRVYLVAAGMLLAGFAVMGRLYQISVVQADYWQTKADSLFIKFVDVEADRGNILATDGSLLATSLPFFDIYFDAKAEGMTDAAFEEHVDSLGYMLSTFVDQQYTPGAYVQWLNDLRAADPNTRGIRYVNIAKGVSYYKMLKIKQFPLFRLGRYKGGLIIEQNSRRERPYKMLAQRTIGYVRDGALPVGLEGSFNNVLGGSQGKQLMIRVPGDLYIPVNDLAEIEPRAGNDVVTTLDINIQDATENALLRALERHDADHGCAIVMEVKTGAIRAIANIGRTPKGWWETYNYAVGERVEPGSMFKLASFMALLEKGAIDDFDKKIPVYQGSVQFYNETLEDSSPHGLDSMSIREVFAQSSNVGTATLMQKAFGTKREAAGFIEQLTEFGLNLPTGIEVGGEDMPYIKSPADPKSGWSGTTLPWMSIGYEVLFTPLQLLTFYNAVANNGRMMKPYLVERIENYGEPEKIFRPAVIKRSIASPTTIRKANELLRGVVEFGTAQNIKNPYYAIAGKTGTAQLNYHKFQVGAGIRYQAGFCGFFPADNPAYSCIVVISEPKQAGYHGAEAAAPVFREIADKCFALKPQLHAPINEGPKPKLAGRQLPAPGAGRREDMEETLRRLGLHWFPPKNKTMEWAALSPRSDSLLMMNRPVSDQYVPNVIGMGLQDAIFLLENRGCKVRVQGVGKVKHQSLNPGERAKGNVCTLYLE
jgi:cell division protein FtsI (penicillin-binding protein 3)